MRDEAARRTGFRTRRVRPRRLRTDLGRGGGAGGWTSHSPGFTVRERGCGDVDKLTFTLTCATASGDQRAERRYATYTDGSRQFEGYFRITSQTGSRIIRKQTFHETGSGAYFMLAVERGGRLYAVHGGTTVGTGATVGRRCG